MASRPSVLPYRTAVAGRTPTLANFNVGELSVNSWDGKLFLKGHNASGDFLVDIIAQAGTNLLSTANTWTQTQTFGAITATGVGTFNNIVTTNGESHLSCGTYSDPQNGTSRDAKFGNLGIAVKGGVYTDTLTTTGAATTGGGITINNLGTYGQLQLAAGSGPSNYGVIHRNDNSNYYILLTASGSPFGAWTGARPFTINLATALVSMSSGVSIANGLTTDNIAVSGTTSLANVSLASTASISFGSNTGVKLNLYSTVYGIGINSGELTMFADVGQTFGFRVGSVTGTRVFYIDGSGDVFANGYVLANGYVQGGNGGSGYAFRINGNGNAVLPAFNVPGWIGWNYAAGNQEVDFFNSCNGPTISFNWYQQTSASAASLLMSLSPAGVLTVGGSPVLTAGLSTSTYYAKSFGIKCDGTTDDTNAINTLIGTVNANGGGTILFPPGIVKITGTITQPYNNVKLQGAGAPDLSHLSTSTYDACTVIKWYGAAGGTVCLVGPAQNTSSGLAIANADVTGILFDCSSLAGIGIKIQSVSNSVFNVAYYQPLQCGFWLSTSWLKAQASSGGSLYEINDSQHNQITVTGYCSNASATTTVATTLGSAGPTVAMTSGASFSAGMQFKVGAGRYVVSSVSGNNVTFTTNVSVADGTAGKVAGFAPRAVWLHAADTLPGGFYTVQSGSYPALWPGNISLNQLRSVSAIHYTPLGEGFVYGACDHNMADKVLVYTNAGVPGIVFDGSNISGMQAYQNTINYAYAQQIILRGTSSYTYPSSDCRIDFMDTGNGTPYPTIETGSSGYVRDDKGFYYYPKLLQPVLYDATWEPITGSFAASSTTTLSIVNNQSDHIQLGTGTNATQRWGVTIINTNDLAFRPTGAGYVYLGGTGATIVGTVTVGSTATFSGSVYVGTNTTASALFINGAAGQSRYISFASANSTRWEIITTSGAESGSNAGSDFWIANYADSGAYIGSPLTITRSSGVVNLPFGLSAGGQSLMFFSTFTDPQNGVARDLKLGDRGIAVHGGTYTDTLTVTGASTLTGAVTANGGISSTGAITANTLAATTSLTAPLFSSSAYILPGGTGPYIGFNIAYSGGWKYQAGTDYGYVIRHDGADLSFNAVVSGTAGAAASLVNVMQLNGSGSVSLNATSLITFTNFVGPHIYLYSTTYGLGINSSELCLFTGGNLVIRANSTSGASLFSVDTSGSISTSGSHYSGTFIQAGSYVVAGSSVTTTLPGQGAYFMWNRDGGGGGTWLINQKGGGGGGFYYAEATLANVLTTNFSVSGAGNAAILSTLYVGAGTGTPAQSAQAEFAVGNARINIRNVNDPGGGFVGNSFNALQLGVYNPSASIFGVVPATSSRTFFVIDCNGNVGSITPQSYASSTLVFRNKLDDGSGNFSVSGTSTFTGVVSANTGVLANLSGNGQIQLVNGTTGYGVIQRNDGGTFYLMTTANNSPSGGWNTLRPFTITLSTGVVSMFNGVGITGGLGVDTINASSYSAFGAGVGITGYSTFTMTPTATSGQVGICAASGANSTLAKLRFYATFGTGVADTGARMAASVIVGYSGSNAWGGEYMNFNVNNGGANDAQSDANQNTILALTNTTITANRTVIWNGGNAITSAPPTAGGSGGWKVSMFGAGYAIGVATYTTVFYTGGWVSQFLSLPANNATATTPDTSAGVSLGGTNNQVLAKGTVIGGYGNIGGVIAFGIGGNMGGVYPTWTGAGCTGSIGWNFTSGNAEIDFWNSFPSPSQSFNWYQQTSASAATLLMSLNTTTGLTVNAINGDLHRILIPTWALTVVTTNINIANPGNNSTFVDGFVPATGDRLLLVAQTDPTQNGLYTWNSTSGASNAMTRTTGFTTSATYQAGVYVFVYGTYNTHNNTTWRVLPNASFVLGTSALTFTQIENPGSALSYTTPANVMRGLAIYGQPSINGINVGDTSISEVATQTMAALDVRGVTSQFVVQNNYLTNIGLISNTGRSLQGSSLGNPGDNVALYAGITAMRGTADVWAFNPVVVLAPLSAPATYTVTGTVTNGSNTITSVSSTSSLIVGVQVAGTGIPGNAFVLSWTSNTITFSGPAATATTAGATISISEIYDAQGIELDFANYSSNQMLGKLTNGLSIVGGGNASNLCALYINGSTGPTMNVGVGTGGNLAVQWLYGIYFPASGYTYSGVSNYSYFDQGNAATSIKISGIHSVLIDCSSAIGPGTGGSGMLGMLMPNNVAQSYMNAAKTASKTAFFFGQADLLGIGDSTTAYTISYNHIAPGADNTYACGLSILRWSSIYAATGVVATSDGEHKKEINTSPLGLNFISRLIGKSYKWIEEPIQTNEDVEEEEHAWEMKDVEGEEPVQDENGKWILRKVIHQERHLLYDHVATHEEDGSPAMRKQRVDYKDGKHIEGMVHRAHKIPLMRKVVRKDQKVHKKVAGTKTYHGFIAQDIKRVVNELGVPFAGLHDPGDGTPMGLNYTELLAPLVNANAQLLSIITDLLDDKPRDQIKAKLANYLAPPSNKEINSNGPHQIH